MRYRDLASSSWGLRLGLPAAALGQGLSEAGFVLAARRGLGGAGFAVFGALAALTLLRFFCQDRIAVLETRAARAVASGFRRRLLERARLRAVPLYRPDVRRRLVLALEETAPRLGDGLLARKRFDAALLQGAILLPCLFLLAWKLALFAVVLAVPAWAALRWRNRSLRTLERAESRGRAEGRNAAEDFGNAAEALSGHGLGAALTGLETDLDRARLPEWRWKLAQARYPALLETGFFFALAGLVLLGGTSLGGASGWILFSGLLLLAYRPVREAARQVPLRLQGAQALRDASALLGEWGEFAPRALPTLHPENAFALRGVDFAYEPGRPILRRFSAEFPADAITGVTGPNGAGKTTLLRLLSGAEVPDVGEVLWSVAARRDGIAYLPQRAHPGADWAAWAKTLKVDRSALWTELNALLRLDRLAEKSAHPEALSGGERQRMALARTLASDAAFLLLDEPTTALPGDEREEILAGALKLWTRPAGAEGLRRGAVIVSHEPFLERHCDLLRALRAEGLSLPAPLPA